MGTSLPGPPPPAYKLPREYAPGGHATHKSADPAERITSGTRAVIAKVRRLERGEVLDLLLGEGPTREWRAIHEALKRGTALRLSNLKGSAFRKSASIDRWARKWRVKYPVLRALRVKKVDDDTVDCYFLVFQQEV